MDKRSNLHTLIKQARDEAKNERDGAKQQGYVQFCTVTYDVLAGLERACDEYTSADESSA